MSLAWVPKTMPFLVADEYQVVDWDADRDGNLVAKLQVHFDPEANLKRIKADLAQILAYLYDKTGTVRQPACLVGFKDGQTVENAREWLAKGLTSAKLHWLGEDCIFVSSCIPKLP